MLRGVLLYLSSIILCLLSFCYPLYFRLLNETKGSLLDDEQLVNTLQTSKVTSQEVSEQLQVSEVTEVRIDAAREVWYVLYLKVTSLNFEKMEVHIRYTWMAL